MQTFELHKTLPSGATEYRLPNSTRTIRFGSRLFAAGTAPATIQVTLPEGSAFAPESQQAVDREAKAKEREAAKAKKQEERDAAKAKKAEERDAAKKEREAAREKARLERQEARDKAKAAAAEVPAADSPAATM